MTNYQVTELYYSLETIKPTKFDSPPPINGERALFYFSLDNDKLTIKLKQYCPTKEEALYLVGDFLREWEINDALEHNGIKRINFKYENINIIDLDNPNAIIIPGSSGLVLGFSANLICPEPCYPKPPTLFQLSPDVRTLWHRYEGYLKNHEPLQSMAYFCYTFFNSKTGGWKASAKSYRIDEKVLNKLSELSSTKGDQKTARKFNRDGPLSAVEIEWLKIAIRRIIRRVGEIDNDPSLPIITLDNLPKLP